MRFTRKRRGAHVLTALLIGILLTFAFSADAAAARDKIIYFTEDQKEEKTGSTASGTAAAENQAPNQTGPEIAAPEQTASENTAPEQTSAENTASDQSASENTASDQTSAGSEDAEKESSSDTEKKSGKTSKKVSKKDTYTYKGVSYKYVYDYKYYTSQSYGKRFAGKPEKAIAYFVKTGMKKQQQAIATFDPKSYRYGCPELREKYRNDYAQYYLHYQKTGHKYKKYRRYVTGVTKMRKPVTKYGKVELKAVYDYEEYLKAYPSVLKTAGDDDHAVLKDFVEKGMKKGRSGRDPEEYPKAASTSSTYKSLQKKIKKTNSFDGTGLIVCIDPGHQARGNYSHEQIGPGSSRTKPKVTSGAYGRYSRKNEYEINLEVSLKLQEELIARGYKVVMTRTTHNVSITNIERAQIANKAHADIMVRIHANDIAGASSLNGVFCYAAGSDNPYLSKKVIARGQRLAVLLRDSQAAKTKQRKGGNMYQNDMTGINWAKMPCAIVEMGYMSNPTEDVRLASSSFQKKIAEGLADGIDKYFLELKK